MNTPKYVLLLPAMQKFVTKAFLCKTKYIYTVGSTVYLNNIHRTHGCVSHARLLTRTRHDVTLFVHYLFKCP